MIPAQSSVLPFEAALALVLDHAARLTPPSATETLPLAQALNRVLATPVLAQRDQPPFDRATRDGFALDATHFSANRTARLIGQLKAGDLWQHPPLQPGEAVEIMTGAPVPAGATAVAMVEHVLLSHAQVTAEPHRAWSPGENIVPQAAEAHAGQAVIPARTLITPAEIALAAASGSASLTLYCQPTVAIVATGDELVELTGNPGELAPQQIWNSNSHALAAMVTASGAVPDRLPITQDTLQAVAVSLARARRADLILFSGGVSMGQYDLVEETLHAAGATFLFTGVQMQPGKPLVFGTLPRPDGSSQYFFGLPGNPISTQVTFHAFAEPFLRAVTGLAGAAPRWALASLANDEPRKPNLTRLLPARLTGTQVAMTPWQGSGDLASNARANCYAELRAGHGVISAGTSVRILLRS
jgi:molybdopterin molybdotransferase